MTPSGLAVKDAPTQELGSATVYTYPSVGAGSILTSAAVVDPNERVPELMWPTSVRRTYPWMRNDTQLSGLYRGTTLPVRRYVWGVDPNGAPDDVSARVCAEFGVEPIAQAWKTFETGESDAVKKSRNRFSFDLLLADALKACYLGHYFFEQVYDVAQDGPPGLNGGWFAHLAKLAPRAPWTVSQIYTDRDGGLAAIRQLTQPLGEPPIPVSQLVAFPFDKEPGEWTGRSMFRSCFREWAIKNDLLHVDLENHRRAGGILLNEAPEGSTPAQIEALAQLAIQMQVGGGGSVPHGTTPIFIRGTGSDVIASINRHDESMAREFLMMFMALGTSSSGGNRALASSFIDWFAISQESIAIWFRDVFNEHVIRDFVELNWGDVDYLPRLVFKRPESANPLDSLAAAAAQTPGKPSTVAVPGPGGDAVPVAAVRFATPDAVVLAPEDRALILDAHADYEQWARPAPTRRVRAAAGSPIPLPDRKLRRGPYDHEVRAAVDFEQIDANWQSAVDQLVSQWQTIRAQQIDELAALISASGGDLAALAQIRATAAGADMVEERLRTMAHLGAAEATAEAVRQGVSATVPDVAALEAELAARASALEQLLTSAISQAAANKAVQLSGGGLAPPDVGAQVSGYLGSLSDAYLADQFGGATSAAQNAGRLAAMTANGASAFYASELLDVNTCVACAGNDGKEYATAAAAAVDYPAGGFAECSGGPRCRGTIVAIFGETA